MLVIIERAKKSALNSALNAANKHQINYIVSKFRLILQRKDEKIMRFVATW